MVYNDRALHRVVPCLFNSASVIQAGMRVAPATSELEPTQTTREAAAVPPGPAPGPDHPLAGAGAGLVAALAPALLLYAILVAAGHWLTRTAAVPVDVLRLPVPPALVLVLAGGLCGAAASLIPTPVETLKLVRPGRAAFLAFVPGCVAALLVWALLPNEWAPPLLTPGPRPFTLDPLVPACAARRAAAAGRANQGVTRR